VRAQTTALMLGLTALAVSGCSGSGHSAFKGAVLTASSSCAQWTAASKSEQLRFSRDNGQMNPTEPFDATRNQALVYNAVRTLCKQEAGPGRSTSVKIGSVFNSQTHTANEAAPSTPSGLKPAGVLHFKGSGAELDESFALGDLTYASSAPPSQVIEECSVQTPENAAYAPMQVTLTYAKGAVPMDVVFNLGESITDISAESPLVAALAINREGHWGCGVEEKRPITLHPGESSSYEMWLVIPNARSNASPTLPREELNTLAVHLEPVSRAMVLESQTVSGPDAANCGTIQHHLLPFATLPFKARNGLACAKGAGKFEPNHI
jgi:hypothetical protein